MKRPEWYARPGIVLSLLGALLLLTALLVRTPVTGREGDPRLSTKSTEPLGAQLFYELAGRFGLVTRREITGASPHDAGTIFAVLDPTVELNAIEAHGLLQHARDGGALLVVLGNGTGAVSDSLGITINEIGGTIVTRADSKQCAQAPFTRTGLWFGSPFLLALNLPDSLQGRIPTIFAVIGGAQRPQVVRPAMIGMRYGRGRIVIAADPDMLRNDALRECSYGLDLYAMDALTYLRGGANAPRTTIVFDEYHQGRGKLAGPMGVAQNYLTTTSSGHTVLQICVGGLLLLLAAATRVLPPREDQRIERRSPLEHVDALARAYAQVPATRTGTLRLVRGLQRRTGSLSRRTGTAGQDELFLTRIAETKPALTRDVTTVRHALGTPVTETEFKEVGNAIMRIEAAFTRTVGR